MADIKIGDLIISNFKVGLNDVDKIYLGDDLLYPQGIPMPIYGDLRNVYNVTDTSNYTILYNKMLTSHSNVTQMWIDGVEVTPVQRYTFSTIGEHIVELKLSNNRLYCCGFQTCDNLVKSTIAGNITKLDGGAFSNAHNLTSIYVGSGVTTISNGLTERNVSEIMIDSGNTNYDSRNNCNAIIETSTNKLIAGCITTIIPNSVTSIGVFSFGGNNVTNITIPNSVTSIGDSAFAYCGSLTSIDIPNSVTSIGNDAFTDCRSLTSVTIPDSVTSIGKYVFYNCDSLIAENGIRYADTYVAGISNNTLTTYAIKNGTKWIGEEAFKDCSNIESITIPDSVTYIGEKAFDECGGNFNIVIPDSVTTIGDSAFEHSNGLTSCTIGSGVTSISNDLFYNCDRLTSIAIPNSVTSIGREAFTDCRSLTGITIPNSVTSIGYSAFESCYSLTSVTIPDSVTSIDYGAFRNCSSLTNITIGSGITSIGDSAFEFDANDDDSVTIYAATPPALGSNSFPSYLEYAIYVPSASVNAYKTAWSDYAEIIQPIPNS